jgi:hypothetical protein
MKPKCMTFKIKASREIPLERNEEPPSLYTKPNNLVMICKEN